MYVNQQAFALVGVTNEDYLAWCNDKNKIPYKAKVRKEFFEDILNDRIVRDSKTGKLITKRGREE